MNMKKLIAIFIFLSFGYITQAQTSIEYAKKLFSQAIELNNQGNLDSAISKLNKAAKIFQKNNDIKNYLITQLTIANFYSLYPKYNKQCKNTLQQIKKQFFTVFSNDSLWLAKFLSIEAKTEYYDGNYAQALNKGKKALRIKEKYGTLYDKIYAYNDLANYYSAMELFQKAKKIYLKIIKLYNAANLPNDITLAMIYNNLANVYFSLNMPDSAIIYDNNAIKIAKQILGENNPISASAYSGIGQIYSQKGENSLALQYAQKALDIKKNSYGKNSLNVADEYINIANILYHIGKYEDALNYNFNAINIYLKYYNQNNLNLAKPYINIALNYLKFGSYNNAKKFLLKALDIQNKNNLQQTPTTAKIYTNLGIIYLKINDYQNALKNLILSIKIFDTLYGKNSSFLIIPYYNLGNIYLNKKKPINALKYFNLSLKANDPNFDTINYKISDNYFDGIRLIETLKGIAAAYIIKPNSQNLIKALKIIYKADTLITIVRTRIFTEEDKLRLSQTASEIYDLAQQICFNLYAQKKHKFIYDAFYFAQRNKGTLLLKAIYNLKFEKQAAIPDTILKKEKYLKEQLLLYKNILAQTTDPKKENTYRNLVLYYRQQIDNLMNIIKKKYPKYYQKKYKIITVSLDSIQNILDAKTQIIDYTDTKDKIFAIVITKSSIEFFSQEKEQNFETQILEFYNIISGYKKTSAQKFQNLASELYQTLFPFTPNKKIKHLIIIPDKSLNNIPFGALVKSNISKPNFKNLDYLIKHYAISYHYSESLLYTLSHRKQKHYDYDFLGIAPVFSGKTSRTFQDFSVPALPNTKLEVDTIVSLLQKENYKTKTLISTQATYENFLNLTNSYSFKIIHLATHAYINSENPNLSVLLFAPKNNSTVDMYGSDIYSLHINPELLVLSACETGKGKISEGEGIIGISRAFIYVGTKNLLISLWQVSDISTKNLMINFYRALIKEKNYAKALQQAKISLINSKFNNPYFWAAFILIGK